MLITLGGHGVCFGWEGVIDLEKYGTRDQDGGWGGQPKKRPLEGSLSLSLSLDTGNWGRRGRAKPCQNLEVEFFKGNEVVGTATKENAEAGVQIHKKYWIWGLQELLGQDLCRGRGPGVWGHTTGRLIQQGWFREKLRIWAPVEDGVWSELVVSANGNKVATRKEKGATPTSHKKSLFLALVDVVDWVGTVRQCWILKVNQISVLSDNVPGEIQASKPHYCCSAPIRTTTLQGTATRNERKKKMRTWESPNLR